MFEETGIEVEVMRLIAVLDGLRLGFARLPMYSLVFHCKVIGGELAGHPLETSAVGFFARDNLPAAARGRASLARPGIRRDRRQSRGDVVRPAAHATMARA